MVIQAYMTVCEVVRTWPETRGVFESYGIDPDSCSAIDEVVDSVTTGLLVRDLNQAVGSSAATCVEGG